MTRDTVNNSRASTIIFLIKNTVIGFILTIALLFIVSWISVPAALSEDIIGLIVSVITDLCIGICGFRAARHMGMSGLVFGAIAGFIYVALLYLIGALAYGEFGFTYSSALTVVISILCGAIGGVIGINTRSKRRR